MRREEKAASPQDDDYERAEKAIFHGIETVEQKIQHAIEDGLHSIYDDMDHHQTKQVKENLKKAVQKGASKVKETAADEYNYSLGLTPAVERAMEEQKGGRRSNHHRVLAAMMAAEQAVLHAVQDEVDSLFHGTDHHYHVTKAIQKASRDVRDTHKERKRWIREMDDESVDEFMKSLNQIYGTY